MWRATGTTWRVCEADLKLIYQSSTADEAHYRRWSGVAERPGIIYDPRYTCPSFLAPALPQGESGDNTSATRMTFRTRRFTRSNAHCICGTCRRIPRYSVYVTAKLRNISVKLLLPEKIVYLAIIHASKKWTIAVLSELERLRCNRFNIAVVDSRLS